MTIFKNTVVKNILGVLMFWLCFSPPLNASPLEKWKDYQRVDQLNQRSWNLRRQDNLYALTLANHALEISNLINYKQGRAYAAKNIATIKWIAAEYPVALEYAQKSRDVFITLENKTETANLYNLMGLIYSDCGENKKAVDCYDQALMICGETKDESLKAVVLGNMGIIFYRLGAYNQALDYYYEALVIHEERRDAEALSNTLTNIALIFMAENKYEEALVYLHQSLQTDKAMNDPIASAICYNNIGICHYQLGNRKKSLHYHKLSMQVAEKAKNLKLISHAENNIGEIYFAENKLNEADSCFKQALKKKKSIIDRHGEITVLINLSRLQQKKQNYDEAKNWCDTALLLSQQTRSLNQLRDCYFEMYKMAEAKQQSQEIFYYYKNYTIYNDSILKQETHNNLQRLQLLHDSEKKEKELVLLSKEKTIESNKKTFFAMAAAFILIISAALLRNFYIKNKKEHQLRLQEKEIEKLKQAALTDELERSKKELFTYTQLLIEKNNQLEEIRKNLEEMDLNENELKEKNRFDKMEQLSRARIITEDDWAEFKRLFENVFKGFFIKLKETYPGITTAEIRLAALLKLKLSTKEIAGMTGVSSDSVKKTRQRIRKKMNLAEEDDLEELIEKL
ncbi:MAG: tetratricopeptide repeat protein [Bacteroidota bacterium]